MRILAQILSVLALLALTAQPAAAQGGILRDSETEHLLQQLVNPLAEAAGLGKNAVKVRLVNDQSVNAFVAGGQEIYINAGLIEAADSAAEVQGVMAHELGHITGAHIDRMSEGTSKATKITLLSALAAVGAAVAGSGDAAMGVMMAGQRAAMGSYLAFTRVQEASADAAGAKYLSRAGISGRGSLNFFEKLLNMEQREGFDPTQSDEFLMTHPLTRNRIARLRATYEADPAWNNPSNPRQQKEFLRIKAKLIGYEESPRRTFQQYPLTDNSIPARYARAYAYHKEARLGKAMQEINSLIAQEPNDPYFLELKGQILLEAGKVKQSIAPLRRATQLTNADPLIAPMLGHALVETGNPADLPEAETVLRAALGRDSNNPFAWYQLGMVYTRLHDIPRARLATSEQQLLSGNPQSALMSARQAQGGLPQNSADWIRAQDVIDQSRNEIEQVLKRH